MFSFLNGSRTNFKENSLTYYLLSVKEEIVGFKPFLRVIPLSKMHKTHLRFDFGSLCPFFMMINVTLRVRLSLSYIYIYIYIYIYTRIYIYMYVFGITNKSMHIKLHICVSVSVCLFLFMYLCGSLVQYYDPKRRNYLILSATFFHIVC